ncbi:MAG: hypothetical protein KAT04_10470, partial [Methylococcales bacterium]|nr:hypothetical protein [Methylococcales bacterium]
GKGEEKPNNSLLQNSLNYSIGKKILNYMLLISPHPNPLGNCSCIALLTYIRVGIQQERT